MYCAPTAFQNELGVTLESVPTLLHEHFETQARLRPDAYAVEFSGNAVTYAELDRLANQMANYMIERGMVAGDLVGIYLKKSPRIYATMLAILKAGGAYVPIDPRFPLDRIQAITNDAKLRFIVSEDALADALCESVDVDVLRLDTEEQGIRSSAATELAMSEISPDDLCYVIYTSGSTGNPKGVMIAHRNACAFVRSLTPVYQVDENDRVYQGFSVAFDASVEEIWAAFSLGGTLVVPTEDVERSPGDVADFINANRITYYSTVPTMLSMVDQELPTVRTLVLGGEACSDELISRWATAGRRMLNTYGPTEATVVATWSECRAGVPVNIGKALPEYTTYVLDEDGQPVPPGGEGELYIGGPGVGLGYMNLPEMTSKRFVANHLDEEGGAFLYRTHDHVRLDENDDLHFLGRLDDQVKVRGFRIELSEIEAVLVSQPEIKAAAVGVTEISQLKELAAFVICHDDVAELDRETLAERLRQKLPTYMVPKFLDVVDDLPMMASGKIDRKQLPAPQNMFKGTGPIVEPACAAERAIAEAWQDCFKLPALSVEADFFNDLGGHSLLASQCINRLRKRLQGVAVSVRDIYEHRNVRALTAELRRRGLQDSVVEAAGETSPGHLNEATSGFAAVPTHVRYFTVAMQCVVTMLYYTIISAPLAYIALMYTAVRSGDIALASAIQISIVVGFAAWPTMLAISVLVKWLVIGKYKPGRYPVWGTYYLRWWIASRFQALSWSSILVGTPLMSLYYRAMGAKIGRNVTISTPHCAAYDVVSIGDGSSVGLESQLLGYRVEHGYLIIAPVTIGRDCFVGMHCALGLNTCMQDNSRLDDMSLLSDDVVVPVSQGWAGAPAKKASVKVPAAQPEPASRLRAFMFGALHLMLIYTMGYFLIAVSLPSLVLLALALFYGGIGWAAAAMVLAVPLYLVSYTCGTVLLVRLLGKSTKKTSPVFSTSYLKHWFLAYLLENTKTILNPVYATIYFPSLMRALGAKVGKSTEISTVSHMTPYLLEIGEGCFLADACIVGGQRINGGTVSIEPVRIDKDTFIGNSALVPGGVNVGSNVLIGVGSRTPADVVDVPSNTRWLGSPSFELPQTQQAYCFDQEALVTPSRGAIIERALTDAARVLIPGYFLGTLMVACFGYLMWAYGMMPLWAIVLSLPFMGIVSACAAVAFSAGLKHLLQGTMQPVVKPLWCRFVWRNELVNGVYEAVAASAMMPLLGTPMISTCLRMMGCKVGKWCFIETTLMSEFDLVHIGDRVSLNLGATIQTHLFEDRVFKADRLEIGDDCSIGNMAFVLYDTQIEQAAKLGSLSVLMKGEALPAGTRWTGIPCELGHDTVSTQAQPARRPRPRIVGSGITVDLQPGRPIRIA